MATQFVVGIDAGGTKTQIAVWATGQSGDEPVWSSRQAGINLDLLAADEATTRLQTMLSAAADALHLDQPTFSLQTTVAFGLAGLDTDLDVSRAQKWLASALQPEFANLSVTLMPDVELALWAGSADGTGLVLIAGTGSNAFGRTLQNTRAKAGGLSHFFSDEGSGFALGWAGLHSIGAMFDGRAPVTLLQEHVLKAYQVQSVAELKQHLVTASDFKHIVAQAAPAVQSAAAAGDPIALAILNQEVSQLAHLLLHVVKKLKEQEPNLNPADLPLFLVGGTLKDEGYRQALLHRLALAGLIQTPRHLPEPVTGALRRFRTLL